MATMNVSLPDAMKAWVERQTETGRYGNASDYVRDLIRRDQDRQSALAELQTLVDEGLASGAAEAFDVVVYLTTRRLPLRPPIPANVALFAAARLKQTD